MGKKSPSQPAPPDPVATANAQAAANKESAIATGQLNQVNQYTPYGNLEYTQRGTTAEGTPQYSATQTLAPAQQQMLDLTNQAGIKYGQTANSQLGSVASRLSQPLDYSSMGAAPVANEATRQAVSQSIMDRLNPQMEQDRAALETRLANQGIGINSEAYRSAIDEMNRQRTDTRLAADTAGLSQMSQLYGLESNARQNSINEMIQQRSQPLNELAAMLTGSQVQAPTYINTPQTQIAPADVLGATYASYNGLLNNYNTQTGSNNSMMGGLFGLGGSLGGGYLSNPSAFSDRRLKTGIVKIGSIGKVGLYRFRYIWGGPETVGVMADEVRHTGGVVKVGAFDAIVCSKVLEGL